jgi:outer membrane beta-barrel protein
LLAEGVMHFDMYLLLGGGVVGPLKSKPSAAGVIGIGQHLFLNDWFALRLEVKDTLFVFSRNAAAPDSGKSLHGLLSATLGVCFYVPPDFERDSL